MRVRSRGRAAAAVALLAVGLVPAAALSLGGGGSAPSRPNAAGVALIGGVPLQQARCTQWVAGSGSERSGVLAALASVVGGPTQYGPATKLSDSQATALFDRACASPIAHGFLLYELYIRAAGFRSYLPR